MRLVALFGAVDLDTLLDWLELLWGAFDLLASTLGDTTEDELSPELPLLGNVPVRRVSLLL